MRVKKVVEKLLALQDHLWSVVPEDVKKTMMESAKKYSDRSAQLEIYDKNGTEIIRLELTPEMKVRMGTSTPVCVIRMSVDTFIDLLTGETDLRSAYFRGELDFHGENWLYYATAWMHYFDRLRTIASYISSHKLRISATSGGTPR